MKTTEQYFQEFYNEIRYQIEKGAKANFTRANQIWEEYQAAQQSVQADVLCTCGPTPVVGGAEVCLFCGLPKVAHR